MDLPNGILERINLVCLPSYSFNFCNSVSLKISLRPSSEIREAFIDFSAFSPLLMKILPSDFLIASYSFSKSALVNFLASLILIAFSLMMETLSLIAVASTICLVLSLITCPSLSSIIRSPNLLAKSLS